MKSYLTFTGLVILVHIFVAHSTDRLFLSIDCGSSSSYNDPVGYTWSGDSPQYVHSGEAGRVRSTNPVVSTQFTTLRYFPTGKKNCYTISGATAQGTKLMVRAGFYYGNYDGLSLPPSFDLLLDANPWATIAFNSSSQIITKEIVYIARGDQLGVCVARSQPAGVPFISSLEIRSLESDAYEELVPNYALLLMSRTAFGVPDVVRYPDDPYDRFWSSYTGSPGVISVTSMLSNISITLDNKPPMKALLHAITPASNATTTLVIPLPTLDSDTKYYYFTWYFAEVVPNANRSFSIYSNGERKYEKPLPPEWGTVVGIFAYRYSLSSTSSFTLQSLPGSALPPFINAQEFFLMSDELSNGTDPNNVKGLKDFQNNYPQLQAWGGDPCLPSDYKWDWLNCSSDLTPVVTELQLSGYGLSGKLADFSALQSLKIIDLHNNSLSGSIPEFLGQFKNLTLLNLSYNHFTGAVPASLSGNSHLVIDVSHNEENSTSTRKGKSTPWGIIAAAVVGSLVFVVLLVALILFCIAKRRSKSNTRPVKGIAPTNPEPETSRSFSYNEVVEITNNLRKPIGKGGSGVVYHGRLKSGQEVAVKEIKDLYARGVKEFQAEVNLLLRVHHKCLVKCLGFCNQGDKLILLYEYMRGGNLRELLSGKSEASASWGKRLEMALNVATGLDYLHSGCQPPIIHRDVKSANILLDENLEAKLADFGLCKIVAKDDHTFISTVVAGTPGYIDPEYYTTNTVTKRTDVYSFGVVLFEIISGYTAVFTSGTNHNTSLVHWAREKVGIGDINGIADPNLRGQYDVNSMWKVADIATLCTNVPAARPTMAEVVSQLKDAIDMATQKQMINQDPVTEYTAHSPVGTALPMAR